MRSSNQKIQLHLYGWKSRADKTQISLEVQPIESKIQVKKLFEPIVNVISEHRSRSKQRARSRVKPRDRSLFFLVNPDGKVSGPHPSSSILAMFHRGLISKKLRVKKYGSTETISISKFVLDLSRNPRNSLKKNLRDGQSFQMNSKKLARANRIMGSRNKVVQDQLSLVLIIMFSCVFGFRRSFWL